MRPYFTERANIVLALAEEAAKASQHNYIGLEHILLGLLRERTGITAKVLNENGIDDRLISDMIKKWVPANEGFLYPLRCDYSPAAMKTLESSHRQAQWFQAEATGPEHILMALLQEKENIALKLMEVLGSEPHKLYIDLIMAMNASRTGYQSNPGLAESLAPKRTETLDSYSRDLTVLARAGKLDPIVGRETEIKKLMRIICRRNKNNPCLIGEPGVGKSAIVEGFAVNIVEGAVPEPILNKRVVAIDLASMIAGTKYRGEFEERIIKVIHEVVEAGNVLLFLDEIHTIIGAGGAEGAIDASNILKPFLARGELQLIGATTLEEYRRYIEKDAALERRFQPIIVDEPSVEETMTILNGVLDRYQNYHNVKILPEAVEAAAYLADRYISDRKLPDKALDLLDEASAAIRLENLSIPKELKKLSAEIEAEEQRIDRLIAEGDIPQAEQLREEKNKLQDKYEKAKELSKKKRAEKVLTVGKEDIARIVSEWTKVPVQSLTKTESDKLLNLEAMMGKRIIGQDEAVAAVARAMRRGGVRIQNPNRPIGSFLFLGPTGVGKTELSKVLAGIMFEKEQSFIRLDMSEYMEPHSVSKMTGSPPGYVGYDEGGQLSELVRRNPYSVILLDEIEKAHPDVLNVLLQILDDGHLTDAKGRKINFKNTVMIMTSNVGVGRIAEPKIIGFDRGGSREKYEQMKSYVMEEVRHTFKPEFINRIDDIIVFNALGDHDMKRIITLLTGELAERCLKQFGVRLSIGAAVKDYLVYKYTDLKMGARPLKRAVQFEIENALAQEFLSKDIAAGSKILVTMKNGKPRFSVKAPDEAHRKPDKERSLHDERENDR